MLICHYYFIAYIRSIPKQLTKNSICATLIYSLISNDVHYFHTLDKKSHFHFLEHLNHKHYSVIDRFLGNSIIFSHNNFTELLYMFFTFLKGLPCLFFSAFYRKNIISIFAFFIPYIMENVVRNSGN